MGSLALAMFCEFIAQSDFTVGFVGGLGLSVLLVVMRRSDGLRYYLAYIAYLLPLVASVLGVHAYIVSQG